MESQKYNLNKADARKIGQVLLYSLGSALIGTLIVIIGQLNVPPQYLFLVPIMNTILYAAQKFLKGE